MRVALFALALLAVASPSAAEPSKLATQIEIRPGFFGTSYRYEGRNVTPGRELRFVFRGTEDVERDRLIEQSEGHYVIGNAFGWPGTIVAGLASGAWIRGEGGGLGTILGLSAMVIGTVITHQAGVEKRAAVDRFNAGLGGPAVAAADTTHHLDPPKLHGR